MLQWRALGALLPALLQDRELDHRALRDLDEGYRVHPSRDVGAAAQRRTNDRTAPSLRRSRQRMGERCRETMLEPGRRLRISARQGQTAQVQQR